MKAIAWDDKHEPDTQQDYFSLLRQELGEMTADRIDLTVIGDPNKYIQEVNSGKRYDFFITDWFDERKQKGVNDARGAMLINSIRRAHHLGPIFVISEQMEKIDENLLNASRPIYLKSRRNAVAWNAYDIIETLRDLSLLVDPRKVFIIYGHERGADGARTALLNFLSQHGVEPVLLESKRSRNGILPDLMRELRTASAFIAICTPDDYTKDGLTGMNERYQPRQNVLFEMGVVYGLARGAERLTILQKWVDSDPTQCSVLPSDWGGYAMLRFSAQIEHCFDALRNRLREIGVFIS